MKLSKFVGGLKLRALGGQLASRIGKTDLVKAFMREAQAALPHGFAYCSLKELEALIRS